MKLHLRKSGRSATATPSLALTLTASLTLAASLSLWHSAAGQAGVGTIIWRGDSNQVAGITTTSWGSGTVHEDAQVAYSGAESLRITTQGLYQGVSIGFAKPFDLGPYTTNKDAYLQFAILLPSTNANGPGRYPGFAGGFPGGPGGDFPGNDFQGGAFPGGAGGALSGGPGGIGGNDPYGRNNQGNRVRTQKAHPIQNLRIVLITSGDKSLEYMLPLTSGVIDNQWKLLSIPVTVIPGLKAEDAQIKEVRLFGDSTGTIYLGKISVVVDATPLTIEPIPEKVVPRNERYRYTARATAGVTPLKYIWNFDSSAGSQNEGEGPSVVHAYNRSGDYVGTLTVSDLYGRKAPVTAIFRVHVTP